MTQITKHELRDKVFTDNRINPTEKLIFYLLTMHRNNKTRKCFPCHQTLADEAGTAKSTVRGSLRKPKKIGYVGWLKGGSGNANSYWFPGLGDRPILPKSRKSDRQNSATDESFRLLENCQSENKQTDRNSPTDCQDSADQTSKILLTNTGMEYLNEYGTVQPLQAERVPKVSSEQADSYAENMTRPAEPNFQDYLIANGIDDPDHARSHSSDRAASTSEFESEYEKQSRGF